MDPISVEYAKLFGIALATNGLSTSQIRNVFGEVRRIQMKGMESISFQNDVLLLKPKLAYSSARKVAKKKEASEAAKALEKVLSKGIDAIFLANDKSTKWHRFENFANFFEAVLAYHRVNEKG